MPEIGVEEFDGGCLCNLCRGRVVLVDKACNRRNEFGVEAVVNMKAAGAGAAAVIGATAQDDELLHRRSSELEKQRLTLRGKGILAVIHDQSRTADECRQTGVVEAWNIEDD